MTYRELDIYKNKLDLPVVKHEQEPRVHSWFLTEIHGADGNLKFRNEKLNLTTDTASGYTNRRDWQSKAMGGGAGNAPVATFTGNATATTATTLTNTGAAFPTTGQALAGMIVAVGPNATGVGSVVWGVIVSNTATALTVDQWYNPGTLAVGTAPNATASYQIVPGQAPAMYLALSTDATAPSSADTTLALEISTSGLGRALGTYSHTAAATTYVLQKVFNATGTATINKEAVFGSAVINLGVMPFESAEPNPPTLVNGDQLTQTVTITIN